MCLHPALITCFAHDDEKGDVDLDDNFDYDDYIDDDYGDTNADNADLYDDVAFF